MQAPAHPPSQRFPSIFADGYDQAATMSSRSSPSRQEMAASTQHGSHALQADSVHLGPNDRWHPDAAQLGSVVAATDMLRSHVAGAAEHPQHVPVSPTRVHYPSVDPVSHDHRQAAHYVPPVRTLSPIRTQGPAAASAMPFPAIRFPPPGETPTAGLMPIMEHDKVIRSSGTHFEGSALQPSAPFSGAASAQPSVDQPSAPQFPAVYGAAKLDDPLPGSPVVQVRSLIKFPAIANGIPSAPPLAAQTPHDTYRRPAPWTVQPDEHRPASAVMPSLMAAPSASYPLAAAGQEFPQAPMLDSGAQMHAGHRQGFPRPAFHVTPLDLPLQGPHSPASSSHAAESRPEQSHSPEKHMSWEHQAQLQQVQEAGHSPAQENQRQQQQTTNVPSAGFDASSAVASQGSPLHSPYPRMISPRLQSYGLINAMPAGQTEGAVPGAQLNASPAGMHGLSAMRKLIPQPSRARDAIGRFERAATFKSAVTDQDANPPALASPTEAAVRGPGLAMNSQSNLGSSFAVPVSASDRPSGRASSPARVHHSLAQMGQHARVPRNMSQTVSASASVPGPLAASLGLSHPAGLMPGMGRPLSPQPSPRSPRRPLWEQLLGSVGTIRRPSVSPPRATSPARKAATIMPSQSSMDTQQMQLQPSAANSPVAGFSIHPSTSLAMQQQQPAAQQPLQAGSIEGSMAFPPASRATFVHSNSWGLPKPSPEAAAARVPPQARPAAQGMPVPVGLTNAPATFPAAARSFQSPRRPPTRAQPTVPSMVRSASRASRRGGTAAAASPWDSLQEQAGPLGAARMGSSAPAATLSLRPSNSIAGAVAAQGFSMLEVQSICAVIRKSEDGRKWCILAFSGYNAFLTSWAWQQAVSGLCQAVLKSRSNHQA